jgi:hypothetical protein
VRQAAAPRPGRRPVSPARLDSTGIEFTRSFRHLDRGSEEPDGRRYADEAGVRRDRRRPALYRRDMIDSTSRSRAILRQAFFAYRGRRLAWRAGARLDCRVPAALGYHVRRVLPARRGSLPAMLNRHSVKNRFLMRIKNADAAVWRAARCPVCRATWRSSPAVSPGSGALAAGVLADRRAVAARAGAARADPGRRRRDGAALARWFR